MKPKFLLSLLLVFTPVIAAAEKGTTAPPVPGKSAEASKKHPLRGVITAVLADRSSIMVKHEDIPGVMRAMTMLFRVDDATLKAAQKGQTITAMMSRQGDEWWLHDVKAVATPAK